jgi:hypothetical protein
VLSARDSGTAAGGKALSAAESVRPGRLRVIGAGEELDEPA